MCFNWKNICNFAVEIIKYMPMNNRRIRHLKPTAFISSTTLNSGLKIEMKESRASERNNTHSSLFFHLLFLCELLLTASCGSNSQYDFKSPDDALDKYESFYHSANTKSVNSAEKLSTFINQWREWSDTVFHFIEKNPSFTAHVGLSMRYNSITDSIRMNLFRLVSDCTLSDVAYVKLHTSIYNNETGLDSIKQKATTFFASLDKSPKYEANDVARYAQFLKVTAKHGIHTHKEFLEFIQTEDIHFRTFLAHIDECASMDMTEITNTTVSICSEIYKMASNKRLPAGETLVFMSMRANRRLILNSKVCHEALLRGKIKDTRQANAYLWMTVQPYISIDDLGIAMLTPDQTQNLTDIAKDYPSIIKRLSNRHLIDNDVSSKLPLQLMRLYMSTL